MFFGVELRSGGQWKNDLQRIYFYLFQYGTPYFARRHKNDKVLEATRTQLATVS